MKFKLKEENVLFTELDNELVIYDVKNNQYISLNDTFTDIFKGIHQGLSQDEIVQSLMNIFEVELEVCKRAVERSVAELKEKGFIEKC